MGKLSTFIILVPNCPLLLSWCQIVPCQIVWCQIVRCQIVRCQIFLQSKSGTIFFISNIYIPKMKNKKKTIFHFNENSNRFQSEVYSSMYMFEIERTHFFGHCLVWYV